MALLTAASTDVQWPVLRPAALRTHAMRLDLDRPLACAGGEPGELSDVVIDASTWRLTHLVVQPHDRHDLARLVPMSRTHVDASGRLALDCTMAELEQLEAVQESHYVPLGERPATDAESTIGIEDAFELPTAYPLGTAALGADMAPLDYDPHVTVRFDRIPKGTVELRRGSEVTSSDDHYVGHMIGLIVDDEQRITELVTHHGHLWGKRELAIPRSAIEHIEADKVLLTVTRDELMK